MTHPEQRSSPEAHLDVQSEETSSLVLDIQRRQQDVRVHMPIDLDDHGYECEPSGRGYPHTNLNDL